MSIDYMNESEEDVLSWSLTNSTGLGLDLPCDVLCVSFTGGSVLIFLIAFAAFLLTLCSYILVKWKKKGSLKEDSEDKEGSETHSYVEIDDWTARNCKDYTLSLKEEPVYHNPTGVDDNYQDMSGTKGSQSGTKESHDNHTECPRYSILLGTIDNDDKNDAIKENTTKDCKAVETSVTVNVGGARRPPPNIFRGWEVGQK